LRRQTKLEHSLRLWRSHLPFNGLGIR
jgi:hypothetical protein